MPTQPNTKLLADPDIPRVTIGGRQWPIPKMAIAQNVKIGPLLIRHRARIAPLVATEDSDVARAVAGERMYAATMTTECLEDFATALFWALKRGHEGLTREEFDGLPVSIDELVSSFTVIQGQTGLFTKRDAAGPLAATPVAEASSPTGGG